MERGQERNANFEVVPTNVLSNGAISYKNGIPEIKFQIGEQDRYLIGTSLRVVGKFTIFYDSARNLPTNSSVVLMSNKLGVLSTFEGLHIQSQRTKQSIEKIDHYNRMLSSYTPFTTDVNDGINFMNNQALALPNFEAQRLGVVNNIAGSGTKNNFAVGLQSGLLSSLEPIPLSSTWGTGGLEITIQLAPDSNVLFTNGSNSAAIGDAFYEFSDVKLIGETIIPADTMLNTLRSQKSTTLEYNSISTYYNTINSTNGVVSLNLGLSKVNSIFGNIIPSGRLNNRSFDGMETSPFLNDDGSVAKIKQLVFTRNGERFPLEYNIDTLAKDDTTLGDNNTARIDTEIIENGISAISRAFGMLKHSLITPANTNLVSEVGNNGYKTNVDGGQAYILGINYSAISNVGVDFSNALFGINMELQLETDNPNTLFLFVHSTNILAISGGSVAIEN